MFVFCFQFFPFFFFAPSSCLLQNNTLELRKEEAARRLLCFVYTRIKKWMKRSSIQMVFSLCWVQHILIGIWDAIVYRHCAHKHSAKHRAQLLTIHKLDNWNPLPVYWKNREKNIALFRYLKTKSPSERKEWSGFISLKHHIEKYTKIYLKLLFFLLESNFHISGIHNNGMLSSFQELSFQLVLLLTTKKTAGIERTRKCNAIFFLHDETIYDCIFHFPWKFIKEIIWPDGILKNLHCCYIWHRRERERWWYSWFFPISYESYEQRNEIAQEYKKKKRAEMKNTPNNIKLMHSRSKGIFQCLVVQLFCSGFIIMRMILETQNSHSFWHRLVHLVECMAWFKSYENTNMSSLSIPSCHN